MTQSPETQTSEQNFSTEEINSAFEYAQNAVTRVRQDPSFHQSCVEADIDPLGDTSTAAYWHAFRMYAGERVDAARQAGQDSLKMASIEVLATTPAYLLEQEKLTQNYGGLPERRYSKEIASYYNGLIRNFALTYPETSARGITSALLTTVTETIGQKSVRTAAAAQIKQTIRGAQHELAFGQILDHTQLAYRPTTIEEDLKGLDYVIDMGKKNRGYRRKSIAK